MTLDDVSLIARLTVGFVLIWAALAKARELSSFRQTLATLGLPWPRVAAPVVPAAELGVGILLVSGVAPSIAVSTGGVLISGFITASLRAHGRRVPCQCFGRPRHLLGQNTLVRAVLLALATGVYAATTLGHPAIRWPGGATGGVIATTIAAGLTAIASWALEALPVSKLDPVNV